MKIVIGQGWWGDILGDQLVDKSMAVKTIVITVLIIIIIITVRIMVIIVVIIIINIMTTPEKPTHFLQVGVAEKLCSFCIWRLPCQVKKLTVILGKVPPFCF